MTELLTAAQMRAIEKAAIDSGEVTGLELMERAGRGVVEAIFAEWPELAKAPHRAVVLCGPGNNGGDGFVVARLLKEWGWDVEVFLYGDIDKLPPDAKVNAERWRALGAIREWPEPDKPHDPWGSDLIVDALFGTGLSRPLSFDDAIGGMLPEWDLRHEPNRPRIVAVDIPSGLCSDSGRSLEESDGLWADLTVTFHRPKLGHYLDEGAFLAGKVCVADIGLNSRNSGASAPVRPRPAPQGGGETAPTLGPGANLVTLAEPGSHALEKADPFGRSTHKYSHGHALILSGGPGATGAARLAARGALRIGAGLVTLGVPPAAQQESAAQLTAIMLTRVPDTDSLADRLEDDRLNALCLGPGLGLGDREAALVATALNSGRATVLDADALTLISRDETLFAALHKNCVLTPHAGEFARLFPDIAERLNAPATNGPAYSKVDASREASSRAGCVVLFKGPDTVIAAPDGRCAVNASVYDRAAPWLATAGAGDVLAGFVAGLLARGFDPFSAAETSAWLHTECARAFGPGLVAEDLPEALPGVLADLLGK